MVARELIREQESASPPELESRQSGFTHDKRTYLLFRYSRTAGGKSRDRRVAGRLALTPILASPLLRSHFPAIFALGADLRCKVDIGVKSTVTFFRAPSDSYCRTSRLGPGVIGKNRLPCTESCGPTKAGRASLRRTNSRSMSSTTADVPINANANEWRAFRLYRSSQ